VSKEPVEKAIPQGNRMLRYALPSIPPQSAFLPPDLEPMPSSHVRLLVVDDDDLVRDTFCSVLEDEGYDVESTGSAKEAFKLLQNHIYDILLCDVYLKEENGLDLLQQSRETFPEMPVILITAYSSSELARNAIHLGASDFVTKPCTNTELPIVIERNLIRHACDRKTTLQNRIALHTSNENVLTALLMALNTRDTETQGHSERVTAYTMEMAEIMSLPPEELYHIERGALLHDIGKIGIPDRILLKPGKLTPEEWVEMKKHPEMGYEMCRKIESLQDAAQIVLHHHETWDGLGYPFGLKCEEIPLGARIFAIADCLDAMTSDRPYRAALPFSTARAEIHRFSGKQFDPAIVEVFLSIPEERWRTIRTCTLEL
jgi:putative nucleotidyltransferase with HDIG domain